MQRTEGEERCDERGAMGGRIGREGDGLTLQRTGECKLLDSGLRESRSDSLL